MKQKACVKGVMTIFALTCALVSVGAWAGDDNLGVPKCASGICDQNDGGTGVLPKLPTVGGGSSGNIGAAPCAAGTCDPSGDVVAASTTALGADTGISFDNSGSAGGQADQCVITTAKRGTKYPCFNKSAPITAAHVRGSNDQLFHGAKLEAGVTSGAPIDVFGVCRYVDKGNRYGTNSLFIPFDKITEWTGFTKAFDPGNANKSDKDVTLSYCVRGGWVDVPANYGQANPLTNQTYQCGSPQPVVSNTSPAERVKPGTGNGGTAQINMPYLRATNYTPQSGSVTYNCVGQDGTTKFTETVNGTFDAITPIPQDVTLPAPNAVPPVGWTLDTSVNVPTVTYNGVCGAAHGTPTTASAPTSNLCAVGVATTPTNQGTPNNVWSWTCAGGTGSGSADAPCATSAAAACSPATVANGTVNADCSIACDTANGYQLSADGKSCVFSGGDCQFVDPRTGKLGTIPNGMSKIYGVAPQFDGSCTKFSCCGGKVVSLRLNIINDCPPFDAVDEASCSTVCNPSTVAHGTVNADCSIACDTVNGYKLSADGKSCVTNCGSASGTTPSNYAPASNLCADGSTPAVTQESGFWRWKCGTSACDAPISTPTIMAGCAVDELINPDGSNGEKPNQEVSDHCVSFGYSSSNQVVVSVGTVRETNMTVSGPQYFYDFGEFSQSAFFGSSNFNRFTVSWSGGLDQWSEANAGDQFWAKPVPNGQYTETAIVTDTYTGNWSSYTVTVDKETSPPLCKGCSPP